MAKATYTEAFAEFAYNGGADHSDRAWLLHDCDVWVRNPHYRGPAVPHPEADGDYCGAVAPRPRLGVNIPPSHDDLPF
jgi:hypothetical protein